MQAPLPLMPPAEIRLVDNLARRGLVQTQVRRGGVPSATVEITAGLDQDTRLLAFQTWIRRDLQMALRHPPPTLEALQLRVFMAADPSDPMKALLDEVRFTRAWYQAPLQIEADERARVEALYR